MVCAPAHVRVPPDLRSGACRYAFLWLIAAEFSNPFMAVKYMMSAVGYNGIWYIVNGLFFALAFAIVRVGVYGYGLMHMARTACVPVCSCTRCTHSCDCVCRI